MKYVIRLWGMEISNIKNVIHGEIEMPQNKKGSILGIYGANGSGKTVVVDCMVLLKYLLSGRQIPSNFYYYINTKGYYHVLRPCKVSYGGKFSHYEINDYLLKVDDTLKLVKNYGCYETREDVISELEKNLAKDN